MDVGLKIIRRIGGGAFSDCYLCRNNKNLVAVKKAKIDNKYEGIKSCEIKEIYCLLKLCEHPNIIPLYEISINDNLEYILTMKYVKLTLLKFIYIENNRDLYFLSLAKQLLSVLNHLHSNKIIHTDIKPDNILIEYVKNDIKIYLIDFGSANVENLSEMYTVVTTYTYRSPEALSYNCNYSNKIDIWSIGLIFYFFIFGYEYVNYEKIREKDTLKLLNHLYNIPNVILDSKIKDKYKYFLLECLIIDEEKRPDIKKLISKFNEIFNIQIDNLLYIIEDNKLDIDIIFFRKLDKFNDYISSRLNYINFKYLTIACSLYNNLKKQKYTNYRSSDEIVFICWFICYQFSHKDVDYDLHDFLPLFNSYTTKYYSARLLNEMIFDALEFVNYNIN